jgi:hypothetical protein
MRLTPQAERISITKAKGSQKKDENWWKSLRKIPAVKRMIKTLMKLIKLSIN